MARLTEDPLLGFARLLLAFIMGVMLFALICTGIAAGAVLVMHNLVVEKMAAGGWQDPTIAAYALPVLLVLIGATLMFGYEFFKLLRRIADSVRQGDPFIPENADRLTRMGWIAVATQVATIPLGSLAVYIASLSPEGEMKVDVGLEGSGLITILVLFILARVFRHGAQMRAELEGTV